MKEEYCPPHELQKLEDEFWKIKQDKGDNAGYTAKFKQFSVICPSQVDTPMKAIAEYIRGLPECVGDFVEAAIEEAYQLAAEINDKRVLSGFFSQNPVKQAHQAIVIDSSGESTNGSSENSHDNSSKDPSDDSSENSSKDSSDDASSESSDEASDDTASSQEVQPNRKRKEPNVEEIPKPEPLRSAPVVAERAYTGSYPQCLRCKEKAAAEAIAVKAQQAEARAVKALEEAKEAGARAAKALEEAKERESRASKALEEANAERTRLNQVVISLQTEVQTREAKLADITARVTVAEERANKAVEARDALTSSFNQLETDREWMRCHGISHIVKAIMDAPETVSGIDLIKQRARDAGFKAGYNRCIGHINILSKGGYIDERSGFRDVDTEALLEAAVASFYDMSLSSVEKHHECLDAADYVDRLRMLYADAEEENTAGDG
ncbi:uncharacterized protein LOC110885775 [Helianthus annuus]|uniref:uncharacterized protein LOC110885775 n=1 Tax=Helianthus annuus TaxID=4232 RepID=UPI001652F5DA|nr:uncharacterized protein LOC110885775 [Helianthus annuus]